MDRVSKVRAVDTESARSGLWTQQGQGCGHRVSKVRAVDIDTTVMTYCTLCLLHIALRKREKKEEKKHCASILVTLWTA